MIENLYPEDPAWLEKLRKMHPFKLFIYVAIIGIVIMFFFLSASFAISKHGEKYFVPNYFTFSTILLLLSSFTISRVMFFYKRDNMLKLHRSMVYTFFLALAFIWSQMKGWKSLNDNGIYFLGDASGSYLYLLSGLHLLHFFGGLIYFLFVYFRVFNAYRDKVKNLIFVTDPYEKMRLELIVIYWHFMDALWLLLYLVFMLPSLKH